MGMDVFGIAPVSEEGEYFRNTGWAWAPLARYILTVHPTLAAGCTLWLSNDGDGLDGEQARLLGEALLADSRTGALAARERQINAFLDGLPDVPCGRCEATGSVQGARCGVCWGRGSRRPRETWSQFSAVNAERFARFCIASGGFEIC